MSVFTRIDLARLPPPSLVENLDYESILAATKAQLQQLAPNLNVDALLESDPITKLLQVMAYRELHLRARVNEAARGVMLATATGSNLDNLAALFGIERLLVSPEDTDAGMPAVYEDDERLRKRAQLAFEGFSTAGPAGAYRFHALSADEGVKDVVVFSAQPGEVEVRVLSREGDGTATESLLATVSSALNADHVRPLTDHVQVKSADVVSYSLRATIKLAPGIGASEVQAQVQQAAENFMQEHHQLGADINRAALFAALYQPGVQNVTLHEPAADLIIDRTQVACGTIGELSMVIGSQEEPFLGVSTATESPQ